MGKFKKRFVVIPILVLAIGGGVYAAAMAKRHSDSFVNVVSVAEADESYNMYWWSNENFGGTLKKGSVQNVTVNPTLKIDEVKVKKGDTVSKGDVLFTYDTKSLELNRDEAENNVKALENQITIANNELAVLKKLQPSENAPADYVPDDSNNFDSPLTPDEPTVEFEYEKEITPDSVPIMGDGSRDEPFVFYVGFDTVVTKEYLESLCEEENERFALFYVCDEEGNPIFARLVDGTKLDRENVDVWCVSDGVNIGEDGSVTFDGGSSAFASFIIQSQLPTGNGDIDPSEFEGLGGMDELFGYPEDSFVNNGDNSLGSDGSDYEISEKDNYVFSKEELKNMISEKEKEIEQLGFQKRQAEINVKKALLLFETGAEVAELSGTVTFLAKDINSLSDSGAYITITSSSGMSVAASIGEFSLSKIAIGTPVTVTDWSSGNTYDGEITSISDKPLEDWATTTESYYEFIVTVDQEFDLGEESYVDISIVDEYSSGGIILMSIFVRSEGGRSYVMVVNDDNVLEKRYVTIGRNYYGEMQEVVNGLSYDDRIAIPYGKTEEGKPVKDVDYNTILWGSGLF